MTKTLFSRILLLLIVFCSFTCKKDIDEECATCPPPPPPHVPKIAISLDYIESSDAWFRVWTTDSSALGEIILTENGANITYANTTARETVITMWGLQPNTSSLFRAYRISTWPERSDSSDIITATTLDTTRSNFTWEKLKFGMRINGYLNDVAIINDTCIYAVGWIPERDSTGGYSENSPNALKWDGKQWNLLKVYFALCANPAISITGEITTVYGFAENDVWFADGSVLLHWNGHSYEQQCVSEEIIPGGAGGG